MVGGGGAAASALRTRSRTTSRAATVLPPLAERLLWDCREVAALPPRPKGARGKRPDPAVAVDRLLEPPGEPLCARVGRPGAKDPADHLEAPALDSALLTCDHFRPLVDEQARNVDPDRTYIRTRAAETGGERKRRSGSPLAVELRL